MNNLNPIYLVERIDIPRKWYGIDRIEKLSKLSHKQLLSLYYKLDFLIHKIERQLPYSYKSVSKKDLVKFDKLRDKQDLYIRLKNDVVKMTKTGQRSELLSMLPKKPVTDLERTQIRANIQSNNVWKRSRVGRHSFGSTTDSSHVLGDVLPSQKLNTTSNGRSMNFAAMETQRPYE